MDDFKTIYGAVFRTVYDLFRAYYDRDAGDADKFWADLNTEFAPYEDRFSKSQFAADMLCAALGELERLKCKGLPPNAPSEL